MNDQFKVGTVCIGQHLPRHPEYIDMECEIIGGLQMRRVRYLPSLKVTEALTYHVRWANGYETAQYPNQLRRKPPKSDSQWADEAVRKLKKQSSDHVVIGKPELIPEETV